MRNRTRTSATSRGGPSGGSRVGVFGRLRRLVMTAVVIGLGTAATGAAIVTAISITTTRTMDAFRNADPAMVQAGAWIKPGASIVASRSHLPAETADVTGSIPPMRTARLSDPAPVANRADKADRLPVLSQVAALQLSPPETVTAVRQDATPDVAEARAPAPAVERSAATTPAILSPTVLTPNVVTTKKYKLASIAPSAPPPKPRALATPLPLPRPTDAPRRSDNAPDTESRTAVYDIAGHTVHMPNGTKLVAHSGYGERFDNPRYVRVKNLGPTPPNVYRLTMREKLFHGVRAIRLNPVFEDKMFGRDGMLAHTYLLGPRGESNGCVSFEDYPKFLQAFLDGKIDRMVVVPDLKSVSLRTARARGREADRYALND